MSTKKEEKKTKGLFGLFGKSNKDNKTSKKRVYLCDQYDISLIIIFRETRRSTGSIIGNSSESRTFGRGTKTESCKF